MNSTIQHEIQFAPNFFTGVLVNFYTLPEVFFVSSGRPDQKQLLCFLIEKNPTVLLM